MPLGDDASVFDALVMGSRAVVVSVVDAETPSTIFPQGAIPFSVVGLCVAAFEAVRERGALALVGLVFRNGTCFETVFPFDVTPLIFGRPLSGENAG